MTTKLTPSLTALRLFLMLEDAHREGRVEHDVFTGLVADHEAHFGDNSPLPRARANLACWEATVLEQMAGVKVGTCAPERLKSSAYCLAMAQSEVGRMEAEAASVKRSLWAALVQAATGKPEDAADSAQA